MRRMIVVSMIAVSMLAASCGSVKNLLTAQDAEEAIRELLSIGSNFGGDVLGKNGAFSKESIVGAMFPQELQKFLGTLETLGLSKEINRFTTTLATAAEKTAEKSVPVFLLGIKRMNIKDAFGIVKNGGTAATDYLRRTIGDSLRSAIAPVMNNALQEYKLVTEWNKLIEPVKLFAGDKLNLDIGNLMSGLIANMMFSKIAEKERDIRTKAEARTTTLLQKVFSKQWN